MVSASIVHGEQEGVVPMITLVEKFRRHSWSPGVGVWDTCGVDVSVVMFPAQLLA